MKHYHVYYESFGCQMNVFDIEFIESFMGDKGFVTVDTPDRADVIIVNTCSVRENAEKRALGRLADLSRHNAVLVACGCMAQRFGERLFDLAPGIDIIAGTDSYAGLPAAVMDVLEAGGRAAMLEIDGAVSYPLGLSICSGATSRYVAITRGCRNYCTYCIVPYLRGDVRSRDSSSIINEIQLLSQARCREVTLIGQNVMAFHDGACDFIGLLERIIKETGIARVRFLTTHPRDVTVRLFELMASEPRICPHIHLPLQSGSDRILDLMNRGYRRDRYRGIIEEGKRIVHDLAVSTDIIVGFPGERDEDFRRTLETVEDILFEAAFTFKYSPRAGTPAAKLHDDVPGDVKRERLRILNETVARIRRDILVSNLDTTAEILLDGKVQKGEYHLWKGRTPQFRNVLVHGNDLKGGNCVEVILKELRNFTYIGEPTGRR